MDKEPTPDMGTPECPRCPSERLIKALGNLLVCPNCDVIFVLRDNVNDFVGRVELLDTELDNS